ncbi:hypothetical protein [Haloarcula amylolytica]|uniref:Uncharacterized protein n=1 Tax=Haloarcula amylolytica JCM 13557 TaxID=1227452 RepID=M0KA64_9EURY|nr:hypothetical protein [Haloarcula amylolytica]EMA17034.1 hypothetical protein C442_17230 [Haloarcula amylolytica JCM 13557]
MLELVYVLVVGIIGVFVVGYATPKVAIWGSLGTAMMWMMAHLIPAFSPDEVLATIGPHILDLFFVFPKAIGLAWNSMSADAGLVGGLAVLLWAVVLLIPYLFGIILGLLTWPELFVFRVIL